ncbi:MAG: aminotransferase class IV [Rickettsiales bacterium]|nr:aminotransferase class IV [Rickettsiales bacterium]
MSRISYLNGKFLPHEDCLVHIEDRAFQFGDGVYEVILFNNNKFVDFEGHFDRLNRSLREIRIDFSITQDELRDIVVDLFKQNNLENGSCYIQISRGKTPRVQWLPKETRPTFNITVAPAKKVVEADFNSGISVMTHEDLRWSRCDIKSLNLLPAAMLNQKAKDSGFHDVVMIRDGYITEGSFSNAFIVDSNHKLITRNADNYILCGITRNRIIKLARELSIEVEERKFTLEELESAKEVFLSSSTLIIRPVTKVNKTIISKEVGKITKNIFDKYQEFIK